MSTNNSVDSPLSGTTGTVHFVGSTSPAITTPAVTTSINDTNGNTWIGQTATASAVNYLNITDNSTTNPVILAAAGTDTNITMQLAGKGTGSAAIHGTSTNDSAAAGYVGELISSSVVQASGVSLSNQVAANVTSISLTAGDWDVFGNVSVFPTGTTTLQAGWVSTTSATLPDGSLRASNALTLNIAGMATPYVPLQLSSTTTVYLSAYCAFSSGSATAFGNIYARRRR